MSGKELHLKAIRFNLEVILRYRCFLIRPEFPIKICICSCTKLSLSSYHILSYISIVKNIRDYIAFDFFYCQLQN